MPLLLRLVMPVVFRETLGHAKVPSTLPSLDLVLELGLVAVNPRVQLWAEKASKVKALD